MNIFQKMYLNAANKFVSYYWSCVYREYREKYSLSKSFRFNGQGIKLYGSGEIIIGENTYLGSFSTIQSVEGKIVRIGKSCRLSHNVRIYTENKKADQNFSDNNLEVKKGDVHIGDYVWIGLNCVILEGVTIGNNSVVGANSVVSENIPENSIFGGVPAKMIRHKT